MNKQILLAVGMILFVAAVVVQGTGAFFTDSETSDVNVFTSGTLELDINQNGTTAPFTTGLGNVQLNPGDTTGIATIGIKNGGSTNLAWFGYFNTSGHDAMLDAVYLDTAKMEFRKIGGSDWEPADQFITDGDGSGPYPAHYQALAGADNKISLREWNSAANNGMGVGNGVMNGALKPGGYEYKFTFSLGMLEDVPNSLQGKTLNMSYTLNSTQVTEAALVSLDTSDSRISIGAPASIKTWLDQQLAKQN